MANASILSITNLYNKEPKRKNRWVLEFDDIPSHPDGDKMKYVAKSETEFTKTRDRIIEQKGNNKEPEEISRNKS